MIQRHISHPPGTFGRCDCGREPKHIEIAGSHSLEPIGLSRGQRHMLQCPPCGRSTGRYPTLTAAIDEWGAAYAQAPLPLRVVPARKARAA